MAGIITKTLVLRLKSGPWKESTEKPQKPDRKSSDKPLKNSKDTEKKDTDIEKPTSKVEAKSMLPYRRDSTIRHNAARNDYRKATAFQLPKDNILMAILYGHKNGKGFDPRTNTQISWGQQYIGGILHECRPLKLGACIAPSGRSVKFRHPGLLHVWVPIVNRIGITVKDNGTGESRFFDLRAEEGGWFPFLRYLTHKAHAHENQKASESKARSTLLSTVLIRNAKRASQEIEREQWDSEKRSLAMFDYGLYLQKAERFGELT